MCADRPPRGFTLVELMVGMLVALLVGIAAMSTAKFYSAPQREGVGTSLAVASATSALTAIAEDIAQAGLGFIPTGPLMCGALNLSRGTTFSTTLKPFSPVTITRAGDSDTVDVIYGTDVTGGADAWLTGASNLLSAQLASTLPVSAGQAVLFAPGPSDNPTTAANGICTVRTVSSRSAAPPAAIALNMDAAGLHNHGSFPAPGSYTAEDRVSVLGTVEWHRFRVVGDTLLLEWPMELPRSSVVMRNVVAFRAQYGVTGVAAGTKPTTIVAWADADTPTWTTVGTHNLSRLRALRLSVLVRSGEPQRPDAKGVCSVSKDRPKLLGVAPALPADWECFTYRTASVTVPLRNLAWGMYP